MTPNQVRNLPAGTFLKRKTFQDFEPRYGVVLQPSDKDPQPGVGITIAWAQEFHPFFNDYDMDDEDDRDEWRGTVRWRRERAPVHDEDHKTWWRNWKRIA